MEQATAAAHLSFRGQKDSLAPLRVFDYLDRIYRSETFEAYHAAVKKYYSIPTVSLTNMGIIDAARLQFDGVAPADIYISGSLKFAPYFQVAATTFKEELTLSTNLYGTHADHAFQQTILTEMKHILTH
ncbi:hypothetical protein [Listeria floridensis]|uniref:hypothetical protein n=1 Tax=Listeria floridensis TaxID=1494962 RepID=UPI0004AD267A|nr:hypothetical protein [Listeria floridensis]